MVEPEHMAELVRGHPGHVVVRLLRMAHARQRHLVSHVADAQAAVRIERIEVERTPPGRHIPERREAEQRVVGPTRLLASPMMRSARPRGAGLKWMFAPLEFHAFAACFTCHLASLPLK